MKKPRSRARVDAVDRLAATYQRARLHVRAMRERLDAALTTAERGEIREAHHCVRSARAWERRTRRRYLRAVFFEYAWLDHLPAGSSPALASEPAA